MRLTANIAHNTTPLTVSHPSPYVMIVQPGEWKEGGAKTVMPEIGMVAQTGSEGGGMMMLIGGREIAVAPFVGEMYQLELFMPEIPGMLNSFQEVMVKVLKATSVDGGGEDGEGGAEPKAEKDAAWRW